MVSYANPSASIGQHYATFSVPEAVPTDRLIIEGISASTIDNLCALRSALVTVANQIVQVSHRAPLFIEDSHSLGEYQLNEFQVRGAINRPLVSKYLILTFDQLNESHDLGILNLEDSALFAYGEGYRAHEKIHSLVKNYYMNSGSNVSYDCIVKYLKALKNRNIYDLTTSLLIEEKKRLTSEFEWAKERIRRTYHNVHTISFLAAAKPSAQDYLPGDFDFVSDRIEHTLWKNAYQVMEGENVWHLLDQVIIAEKTLDDFLANEQVCRQVESTVNQQRHLGFPFSWSICTSSIVAMAKIRKMGWKNFVTEYLARPAREV